MKVITQINIINAINIIFNINSCYLILSNSTSFRIRKTLDILVNPQDHLKDVVFGIFLLRDYLLCHKKQQLETQTLLE